MSLPDDHQQLSSKKLDYSNLPPQRISALAVIALVLALIGFPCVRLIFDTRPFWTNHPLAFIRPFVVVIPIYLPSLLGLAFGVAARMQMKSDPTVRGRDVANAAISLSACWLLLLAVGAILLELTGPWLPSPH